VIGPEHRGPGPLTCLALRLYPRAWRERYADEVGALLEDTGSSPAAAASLAVRAVPAWVNPPRHLHDREARMRASVGTVLVTWSALTGIGIVFARLTQLQGFRTPGHPLVQWCYLIFDAALALSVLTAAAGGLPLWLQMIRLARRQRRRPELAWLSLAVVVPAGFAAVAVVALTVVSHPEASGPWWFVGSAILGLGAAGLSSAGPVVALNRPGRRACRRSCGCGGCGHRTGWPRECDRGRRALFVGHVIRGVSPRRPCRRVLADRRRGRGDRDDQRRARHPRGTQAPGTLSSTPPASGRAGPLACLLITEGALAGNWTSPWVWPTLPHRSLEAHSGSRGKAPQQGQRRQDDAQSAGQPARHHEEVG